MRRLSASLFAMFAAVAALAGLSAPPDAPQPPVPFGASWSAFGDSRDVQEVTSMGPSGFLSALTGFRIRYNAARTNYGIGGQNETQAFAWPRNSNPNPQAKGHLDNGTIGQAGAIFTVTTAQSNPFALGQVLYQGGAFSGATLVGTITGSAANSATCGGSACTGSGGTGTYLVSNSALTFPASSTFWTNWVDTKTIAEEAASADAIVSITIGTNSNGGDIASTLKGIKGLTAPGWPYPGYRPNGEGTDQPLPLYPCTAANTSTCRGYPKVVILYDETRKGVAFDGSTNNNAPDLSPLRAYAKQLLTYDYASLSPNRNPQLIVVDSFDMGGYADTASGAPMLPKAGFHPDGLHYTPNLAWLTSHLSAARLMPAIERWTPLARFITTETFNSSDLTQLLPNPLFTGTTGTITLTGATVVGTAPTNVAVKCGSCSGYSFTLTTTSLGSNMGNQLCVRVQQGTGAAGGAFTIQQVVDSTHRGAIVAGDTIRYSWKESWSINSGRVYSVHTKLIYNSAFTASEQLGDGGAYASGGNNMLYRSPQTPTPITTGDTSHSYLLPAMVGADVTGLSSLSGLNSQHIVAWYGDNSEPVDLTYCLAQDSLLKI